MAGLLDGRRTLVVGGVVLPLVLVVLIALWVFVWGSTSFDEAVLLTLHGGSTAPVDDAMAWISRWSLVIMPVGALAFGVTALLARRPRSALALLLGYSGANVISTSLKRTFDRQRPDLWPVVDLPGSFSFPSGHSITAMAFALSVIVVTWRSRAGIAVAAVALAFAFWTGISRLYLGVHYPTDVAAGWLLAVAWVSALTLVLRLPEPTAITDATSPKSG